MCNGLSVSIELSSPAVKNCLDPSNISKSASISDMRQVKDYCVNIQSFSRLQKFEALLTYFEWQWGKQSLMMTCHFAINKSTCFWNYGCTMSYIVHPSLCYPLQWPEMWSWKQTFILLSPGMPVNHRTLSCYCNFNVSNSSEYLTDTTHEQMNCT